MANLGQITQTDPLLIPTPRLNTLQPTSRKDLPHPSNNTHNPIKSMATAAHEQDDFQLNNHEPPPPAYELSDTELDRKIAAAAQRSLASSEQNNLGRPNLPPIDEDGFPIWSDELFEFNRQQREFEAEEARNSKAQSEYRPSAQHHYSAPSASASTSSSPPPVHARPLNNARRSLPPAVEGSVGLNVYKQKQDRLGWMDENAHGIARDDDPDPPMTATQNGGRAPTSVRPPTQLQVQVGPRPHDMLAQPQSPVSDVEDDIPGSGLNRAPTYHPRGQAHPGHARVISERCRLARMAAVAPSLEGPAYEEVMRTTTPATRPAPSANERRQSGVQGEWRPVQAKPQVQERVAGVRHSTIGVPAAQPTWATSPSTYTASPSAYTSSPVTVPVPTSVPATTRPSAALPPLLLPPLLRHQPWRHLQTILHLDLERSILPLLTAQRRTIPSPADKIPFQAMDTLMHKENCTIQERTRFTSTSFRLIFSTHLTDRNVPSSAVISTISKTLAFKAPPPPPVRMGTNDDDGVSVLSGRSGGGRQGSVYSGGAGARVSMYGGAPVGGIMSGGASAPGTTTYVPPLPLSGGYQPGGGGYQPGAASGYQSATASGGYQPAAGGGYQPGLGAQVPGAGGYQPNVQAGAGGYQPQWTPSGQPVGTGSYQPQSPPGAFNPQSSNAQQSGTGYQPQFQPQPTAGTQPQAEYQPQQMGTGTYQPQASGAYQPQQVYAQPGTPMAGQAGPAAATFVAPPPPPKKVGGKLYKRL
ncbi:hypothetical protein RhiLY_00505 [Ceratobasidium sp. AG-Ba]|nr:hypothetical protein RhiLY_00505 [Ceratobasidium sp. AG-Ba]